MATITETATYDEEVYQIGTDDAVIGGEDGIANASAKNLANRTAWLKQQIENVILKANLESNNADLELLAKSIEKIANESAPEVALSNAIDSSNEEIAASSKAVNDLYLMLTAELGKEELGTPFWHLGETPPIGAMQFEGQILDRSEYQELWDSLKTPNRNIKLVTEAEKTASNLIGCWGLGDNSLTFSVPEIRGEFLRIWDGGRGADSGRVLGSWQVDSFKSHAHKDAWARDNNNVDYGGGVGGRYRSPGTGYTTSSAGGAETRPRNVAWMLCFYY
ncbi:tail fiber protein [Gammaproteobacteria bacterium AS21]